MGTLLLIFTTFFVGIVCGAVILIQSGGWLAIFAAILSICYFFLSSALILILGGYLDTVKKRKGDESK